MASETPGKNGTLWLFAPVQSGSPPSRALDFHCHHRKHSATTNFQQATSASPGVPQRWKQHTWLHWGARNIFTLHIQKIENGYLPELTHSQLHKITLYHLCSPYLLHPSEVCLLQGIDSWLCRSSLAQTAKWVAFRNVLLWQNITTSSQEAFSEPFFWRQNESDFFFKKNNKEASQLQYN